MVLARALPVLAVTSLFACGGDAATLAPVVDAPPAAPDAPVAPARLSISGTQILDPSGNSIILRGYNWGEWGTALAGDAADNKAQGASSVRLPLRWWGDYKPGIDGRATDAPGHIDPAHLAALDQTVEWATSGGLWVVLFVDSNYGQGAHDQTDNFWTDAAMKQEFIEVWKFLVARYRSTPYIAAYEILPEPQVAVSDADVRAFYDSVIVEIRTVDPVTPLVVGPGNSYSLKRLDGAHTTADPRIIYTGDYFIFADTLDRMPNITEFQATYHAPVWINQVGIPSGNADAQAKSRAVLGALNDAGVGWAWWTYRAPTMNPALHGIFILDANGNWIEKPGDWLGLVGDFLR